MTWHRFLQGNRVFVWITAGTALVLMIPAVAMRYTDEVRWEPLDFLVMGMLLWGSSAVFVLGARRLSPRLGLILGAVMVAGVLYVWAELSVGLLFSGVH